MIKNWLEAFRLRTLPAAWACIGMGGILAAIDGKFEETAFGLILLTATFLQILSNLANDYGDFQTGLDGEHRVGPQRTVQAGKITAKAMRQMMIVFALLSLVSGLLLLYVTTRDNIQTFFTFLGLGLASILAAITYTVGKKPYGYAGLGDISVMIFFGWVGVGGTYFLLATSWNPLVLLPATSCGFLTTGILNVNNIRDIESDKLSGKKSLPVRMGRKWSVIYHFGLLGGAVLATLVYVLLMPFEVFHLLFLGVTPLLFSNARAVKTQLDPKRLDPFLKQLALSTLLFVVLFGVGFGLGSLF
ncbi:MAG: 1,4-dihydroxy-2-naphthoate polyprenyltransferase [Bacteroidota bacterium]